MPFETRFSSCMHEKNRESITRKIEGTRYGAFEIHQITCHAPYLLQRILISLCSTDLACPHRQCQLCSCSCKGLHPDCLLCWRLGICVMDSPLFFQLSAFASASSSSVQLCLRLSHLYHSWNKIRVVIVTTSLSGSHAVLSIHQTRAIKKRHWKVKCIPSSFRRGLRAEDAHSKSIVMSPQKCIEVIKSLSSRAA